MNTKFPLYSWHRSARTEPLKDTPIVLIAGQRQADKSTWVRQLADPGPGYLTLGDEMTLLAAKEDPVGMIRSLDRAIIDEIQRTPPLFCLPSSKPLMKTGGPGASCWRGWPI